MYDISDEATGLPPLSEIDADDSIFVVAWQLGSEGLVNLESEAPVPVRYLSLRGVVKTDDGAEYSQVHIAFPHNLVRPMLETWLEQLDDDTFAGPSSEPDPDVRSD